MILMLGDIHGNFKYLRHLLKEKQVTDCAIIQVGDFGIGFTSDENDRNAMTDLNVFLMERNITMYAIRGNHDNPKCFDGSWKWSNLHLVPDYTVLNLDGKNILLIGGAISIDRQPRIVENRAAAKYGSRRRYYWSDEKVVFNEEFIKNIRGIDILVTHTAPDFCLPSNKFGFGSLVDEFAEGDKTLKVELTEEREILADICDLLNENNRIEKHYYGHFHTSNTEIIANCEHILLNINELKELR